MPEVSVVSKLNSSKSRGSESTDEKGETIEKNTEEEEDEEKDWGHTKLKQFDRKKIKLDSFILVVGKRRFGKSTWTEDTLRDLWPYFLDGGYVFTNTKHNGFWQQHFPDERIYAGWQEDVATTILAEQKSKVERFKSGDINKKTDLPYIVVILDDIISNDDLRYSESFNEFCFSGRHFNMFVVLCTQDVKGIGPKVRQNTDIIAATYQTQDRAIDAMKKDYADIFGKKDDFKELLKANTQDHQMVIIDQSEAHYKMEDVFFVDKADINGKNFRIGDNAFWKESGCNWKEQNQQYKNLQKNLKDVPKEKWLKVAKSRIRKDKRQARETRENGDDEDIATNQIGMAPKQYQESQKDKKPTSYISKAVSSIQNHRVHFIPPPRPI